MIMQINIKVYHKISRIRKNRGKIKIRILFLINYKYCKQNKILIVRVFLKVKIKLEIAKILNYPVCKVVKIKRKNWVYKINP